MAVEVFGGAAGIPVGDLVGLADEGGEQGFVAEVVYDAWDAFAAAVDGADGPGGEAGAAHAAGEGEPVLDVVGDVAAGQRAQFVVDEDALAELTELLAGEDRFELGLALEHVLEELLFVGFEIGEEADLG